MAQMTHESVAQQDPQQEEKKAYTTRLLIHVNHFDGYANEIAVARVQNQKPVAIFHAFVSQRPKKIPNDTELLKLESKEQNIPLFSSDAYDTYLDDTQAGFHR